MRCPFCYNTNLVLHPEKLPTIPCMHLTEELITAKLADYIAMDIKAPLTEKNISGRVASTQKTCWKKSKKL